MGCCFGLIPNVNNGLPTFAKQMTENKESGTDIKSKIKAWDKWGKQPEKFISWLNDEAKMDLDKEKFALGFAIHTVDDALNKGQVADAGEIMGIKIEEDPVVTGAKKRAVQDRLEWAERMGLETDNGETWRERLANFLDQVENNETRREARSYFLDNYNLYSDWTGENVDYVLE